MPGFKPINRRAFLRGTGALISLPFLEAMIPQRAYAQSAMPKRLAVFCFPNGVHNECWAPTSYGTGFAMPTNLAPLSPYRNRLILTRGLGAHGLPQGSHMAAIPYFIGEPIEGCRFQVRTKTADMMISDHIRQTNAALLPLVMINPDTSGYSKCDSHGQWTFESGMMNYLSWTGTTSAASQISNPQAIFDQLFSGGVNTNPQVDALLAFRRSRGISVLDSVLSQATSLNAKLGADDRQKMDQYFTAIREVEKTIKASAIPTVQVPICNPGTRPGSGLSFDQSTTVLMDLIVLAFACDKSRVATYVLDNEVSNRMMPWLGFNTGHHDLSHTSSNEGIPAAQKPDRFLAVTNWYANRMAYLLGKMQSYQEGDRDLLYNSVIVYGSGMGPSGQDHDQRNIPVVIAGELGGTIRTGQALNCANTRMANLWVSIMQKFGINVSSYASSTGSLNLG